MSLRVLGMGLALGSMLAGCTLPVKGSGVLADEKRTVAPFSALVVRLPASVEIRVSDSTQENVDIAIEGDDNVVPRVATYVEDDTLIVESLGGEPIDPQLPLLLTLTSNALQHLETDLGASLEVSGLLNSATTVAAAGASSMMLAGTTDSIRATLSGASTVDARGLDTRTANLQLLGASRADLQLSLPQGETDGTLGALLSGGSILTAFGHTAWVELGVSGGGSVDTSSLYAQTAVLDVSEGSLASVCADDTLDLSASGGSQVFYSCDPSTVEISLTGGSLATPG